MNDKEIRRILIEYLKATYSEIRIYQEKSIGNSICDLLAVTDCLIGFEIKSGRDNYNRLKSQIISYKRFFDLNYIVVGREHGKSVADKVPDSWGIIVVETTGITVVRKAKRENGFPWRRNQLSILWKLELKNLLLRASLPAYTYQNKNFIIDQILSYVNDEDISKHVAYELMHRDYSRFNAKDYSIYSVDTDLNTPTICQHLPTEEIIDTLSEQDFDDVTLDQWIAIYKQAKELQQSKEAVYKASKPERSTHDIPYTDIEAVPGVPWIGSMIISDFVVYLCTGKELWEVEKEIYTRPQVNYDPLTGSWFIERKNDWADKYSERLKNEYGLSNYNALYILEGIMNLRTVKRETKAETLAVLDKQEKIRGLFQAWLWMDEDRRWEVEENYNRMFHKFTQKHYDGSSLQFPEMNEDYHLYPYQLDAVQRILNEKNTLLAFDVGAGKTYIMIAAAMKLRQQGLSNKNMFVVPNNIVGQWELMFKKLYPKAKVLAIDPRSFKPEMRQKVLRQIQQGDYDGIIMAYSCFEMIPLRESQIIRRMKHTLLEIDRALDRAHGASGISSALQNEKNYIKEQTKELSEAFSTTVFGVCYEDLEISTLFLDEAHNFKNIPIRTNLKNVNGINKEGSKKCLAMLHKVRCIQESNVGRGVVFATGTPLCNSITDAYAMQMYLQYEKLKNVHLDVFDNWVKTFAKPERVCEINVDTSKFRYVHRLARFFNLPELSKMFSSIAIFHAMDEEELPELDGYDDTLVKSSVSLQCYMDELCMRTERIRTKDVDPTKDNMLKVSTDGRKAALDLRLVGKEQPYDKFSKLFQCVQNVMKLYGDCPGCSQIVFCDYSTPKKNFFSVYDELRSQFIACGVPAKEIAFIHSYHTEARKVALYNQVNEGKVRILIGSTFKLGIGANVQTRLKAVHHLDVPWRPADMVQREGRILRKGNSYSDVKIFRYITQGSFDAYSWQVLETKQKFISQFLSGSTYQRSASDLEENVMTFAQVKALAISEPLMKDLAEKQNELRKIQLLLEGEEAAQEKRKKSIQSMEVECAQTKKRCDATIQNAEFLAHKSKAEFSNTSASLKELFETGAYFREEDISVLDFSASLHMLADGRKPIIRLHRLDENYSIELGDSATGNARRVINFLRKMPALADELKSKHDELVQKIALEKKLLVQPSAYSEQIKYVQVEIDILMHQIEEKRRIRQRG